MTRTVFADGLVFDGMGSAQRRARSGVLGQPSGRLDFKVGEQAGDGLGCRPSGSTRAFPL